MYAIDCWHPDDVEQNGLLYDIADPTSGVQVERSADGKTLWVNIGAVCVLRISRIEQLEIKS